MIFFLNNIFLYELINIAPVDVIVVDLFHVVKFAFQTARDVNVLLLQVLHCHNTEMRNELRFGSHYLRDVTDSLRSR